MHWKLLNQDGEIQGFWSGYDLMRMCHVALTEHLPDGHTFVGLLPVATTLAGRYHLFGVTLEGGLINTGLELDATASGWYTGDE